MEGAQGIFGEDTDVLLLVGATLESIRMML